MLVVAQLEVGERVRAVSTHELDRIGTGCGVREAPRPAQRPEEDRRAGEERHHAENPDGQPELPELVVEGDRRMLPGEKIPGGAQDGADGRLLGRTDPDRGGGDEH